ncbi:helix-turn-helix domain-containing protein [Streptomyces sp. NPDC007856]|uniref:helix-turn-helix domain-containing protein n=1 Tax=Streptomyces sp. NPDC007856 TaxID=3364781 RepID=UPI00368D6825
MEVLPGLSVRARRLLLEGDAEGRYAGRSAGEAGYRLTMALAVACSQPGREWTFGQFWEALVLRPTAGGAWARSLRTRKGDRYAEGKLSEMLAKARRFVGSSEPITCRTDAVVEVQRVRQAVEAASWWGSKGGVDEKNLTARLRLAERSGGLDHQVSVRQLAELMGCARSTVESSNARLREAGWLRLLGVGSGKNAGSRWLLRIPDGPANGDGAAPGQLPAARERGAGSVPGMHDCWRSTRSLDAVMAEDAFHHYAHGSSGARLLACLDPVDGAEVAVLAAATGLHRTTVRRRLVKLAEDGFVEEADGRYYLARRLAGSEGAGVQVEQEQLQQAAVRRGTQGLGERRRQRHRRERENYRLWQVFLQRRQAEDRRRARPPLRLVPEGVVDQATGELLDEAWRGWDLSDPARPAWLGEGAVPVRTVPEAVCA